MKPLIRPLLFTVLGLASLACAAADPYPNKPIRIVVPFAPGGSGDFIVRTMSDRFAAAIKQSVVVENRGGGNTVTGTEYVARSAPDGYTLLFASTALSTNPSLVPNLSYRTPEDFAPVAQVISYPFVLAARNNLEVNNIPELIAYAKKNPGAITASTSGDGSGAHLATALLKEAAGIDLLTIPYKGAGPAMTDVAAGHVDMTFTGMSQVKPFSDSKKVKILATSGINRMSSAPDVKTIAEQGLPGFNAVVWWGMLAPAGTPKEIVDKINQALKVSLADPEVEKRMAIIDGEVRVSTPQEFEKLIRDEVVRWKRLIKPSGVAAR
ncbi:tripartite tricarboxylate transporter substrate binding protein [Hydrogenophaga sp.]|uniref:Bug family tripartite tricarboxylate transporter substrate binding protein n=1 Tax=Hydrogenophaga sp. TaxID=1904254 RepID=UPI002719F14F|nr:tripartite tricarboxylate transporter substrate binding protein [Hydrogenophaga sp.]MDO9436796.1 tripartite tricarboxylate transporter substrate binding protein [Hydrogenophaga sp.]